MTITRGKHAEKFTIIGNKLLQSSELSYEAKGMLVEMLSYPNDWTFIKENMMKKGFGRDRLNKVLKELKQAGYLELKQLKDSRGKMVGYDWIVRENGNNQHTENPSSGFSSNQPPEGSCSSILKNRRLENQLTGKQHLQSNNIQSSKKRFTKTEEACARDPGYEGNDVIDYPQNTLSAADVFDNLKQKEEKDMIPRKKANHSEVPFSEILSLYNTILGEVMPKCKGIDLNVPSQRSRMITMLWRDELQNVSSWKRFFTLVKSQDFLIGKKWANFDFILRKENYYKILEGYYAQRNKPDGEREKILEANIDRCQRIINILRYDIEHADKLIRLRKGKDSEIWEELKKQSQGKLIEAENRLADVLKLRNIEFGNKTKE